MTEPSEDPDFVPPRKDRLLREHVHDSYKVRGKLPEPTCCPQCGAVYRDGRWGWGSAPSGAHQQTCPACHRVRDKYPGGSLSATGAFVTAHREEVVRIARNQEKRAKSEHPLERIIEVESRDDGVLITTTSAHLARAIGEALRHAHHGKLDFHYVEDTDFLEAKWSG
jgi:hypothetical protein